MKWIDMDYSFPKIDREAKSYFETCDRVDGVYPYHFRTLPEFRALLRERLQGKIDEDGLLEICKETFRRMPKDADPQTADVERKPVDFIYQL